VIEQTLSHVANSIALGVEAIAVLLVAYGAAEGFVRAVWHVIVRPEPGWRKGAWVDFGMWLLLGLQFALGADIIRSVIAPTWEDIGHLAAIAVIRTFLNYFLERDIAEAREREVVRAAGR
jgi:uncharacterized membrane protein